MTGPGADGELLINNIAPDPFLVLPGGTWAGPGTPTEVSVPIPVNANLIGVSLYVQGQLIDVSNALGVINGLTTAIEMIIQP